MGGAGAGGYERSEGASVIKMIYIFNFSFRNFAVSHCHFHKSGCGKELLLYALDGVCMEIPQRVMMQTFSGVLFMHWGLDLYLSIPVTAFVWCISICIQCLICKLKFDRKIVIEIAASFLFSMGVGLLLLKSGFIGLPMAGHFLERILSTIIRKIRR